MRGGDNDSIHLCYAVVCFMHLFFGVANGKEEDVMGWAQGSQGFFDRSLSELPEGAILQVA